MTKARLFVISAPSGTGKSTIVCRLCEREPGLLHSVSCTTRSPRPGEIDGLQYEFISTEEFQRRINDGYFLEWAQVHHAFYGTPRTPIVEALQQSQSVIMDIDVQGGMEVKKAFPDAVTIFLLPPDLKVLENRLRSRRTDDERQVALRMAEAANELKYADRYDYRVVNDELEHAVSELHQIMMKEMTSNL
ncbi:MAG: guanylate kinase [Deltaproteobacteria bacterium]|nr:guanylate kinase [Deltaproteobacteria bacterium]